MQLETPLWITLPIVATTIAVPALAWLAFRKVALRTARSLIAPSFVFLSLWVVIAFVLSASGFFAKASVGTIPPMAFAFVPLIVGYLGYLALRSGRDAIDQIPMHSLIGLQLYRAVGAVFLVEWMLGVLPGAFALPAGIGDVVVGLAAPFVAARVRSASPGWREGAIMWNVLGIADLAVAVTMGVLSTPGTLHLSALGDPNVGIVSFPLVLIPTVAVPFSILLHLIGLHRLSGRAQQQPALGLSKAA